MIKLTVKSSFVKADNCRLVLPLSWIQLSNDNLFIDTSRKLPHINIIPYYVHFEAMHSIIGICITFIVSMLDNAYINVHMK